jgi:signal transduction histidine kinase
VLSVAGPALLLTSLLWGASLDLTAGAALDEVYPNLVFGTLLPALGALVLSRLPGHPVGRLYLACGLASDLTIAAYTYAQFGLVLHPGSLPGALAAGWVSSYVWTLGFAPLVTLGVVLFPDGHPPGRRWRPVVWLAVVAIALMALSNALAPGPLTNHAVADNPLGLPLPKAWFETAGAVGFGLLLVAMVGSAASAVVRWTRSSGEDRAALSWFAFAAVVLVATVMLPVPGLLGVVLTVVVVPLLPLAAGVAVLRGRLYGIDVVASRSLVYVALTSTLLLGYAGAVVLLGEVLHGHAGPVPALVATAAVAVAFSPLRARLQRSADRLVYGERSDPYAVLTGVGRRLDAASSADDGALGDIAEAVATSLRLPYVRVEVHAADGEDDVMAASWGDPVEGLHPVPLSFRGHRVGVILAAPRSARDPFRAADLRLLDDLGRQIGVTAHAMLLSRDLQRSRERIVATREEERRRLRRDLHDGLGPALAGVALGLDAVTRLVPARPDEAARLIDTLKAEVQASVDDVRRLVEDLRPPALDQLGLVRALEQHAGRINERDPGLEVSVEADPVPPLPAAVEVAAYRILTEALNNVAKHAGARHASVRVTVDPGGELLLGVDDDGSGLDGSRPGVGLTAMHERATELGGSCEAAPAPGGGTRVFARIPLGTP